MGGGGREGWGGGGGGRGFWKVDQFGENYRQLKENLSFVKMSLEKIQEFKISALVEIFCLAIVL